MEQQKNALVQPLPVLIGSVAQAQLNLFEAVKQSEVNRIPFEGSWTAAELIEHMVLSISSSISLFNGPIRDTNRVPDQYVQYVKDMFLNFDLKFKSAPSIAPAAKLYDRDILIKKLRTAYNSLIYLVETKDLTDTCELWEFPTIGYLTRLEWAYQAVYHAQRHTQQLKNIIEHLGV
ncbi:DinB family protein [Mucilaginibacter lappiensis]|uniref:DinB-like domain-containing protein n=1 Tax=Mucilaginibacter lappiensis TaxID=354630 RepID=A0A1N7EFX1_9SPHI|nr:DinB family protein [Mucilaginibacter lappiensis]MBB6111747.1 hypothetical protein [Mucilaginibacter lappiensis]MBB6128390.1 hypothetical protein [Mucilaginibacter lappiensis]SIR86976.1 DinB superfamily protein [Mucilaginibacter lappiensis]